MVVTKRVKMEKKLLLIPNFQLWCLLGCDWPIWSFPLLSDSSLSDIVLAGKRAKVSFHLPRSNYTSETPVCSFMVLWFASPPRLLLLLRCCCRPITTDQISFLMGWYLSACLSHQLTPARWWCKFPGLHQPHGESPALLSSFFLKKHEQQAFCSTDQSFQRTKKSQQYSERDFNQSRSSKSVNRPSQRFQATLVKFLYTRRKLKMKQKRSLRCKKFLFL